MIQESGEVQKLYDVFEGDAVEVRNKKRKSKMVFEKGVDLFAKQKLPEARQHFIEVLKMAPGDKAAKYYLLRCDQYLSSACERNIFIETYGNAVGGESHAYNNQNIDQAV